MARRLRLFFGLTGVMAVLAGFALPSNAGLLWTERASYCDPNTSQAFDRFGDGELEGWSALQFIETSSITLHADEVSGRCFVDVFSCRPFDADVAASLAGEHFGGTSSVRVLQR